MPQREGTLYLQASGRWAILRIGREPFELTSGDVFRVEVDGKLQITRMEHLLGQGYYSVDGYPLRDGMRAAIGVEALPRKKNENVRPRQSLQVARRRLGDRRARSIARCDHSWRSLRARGPRQEVARQDKI
jgi:Domain of unknown function (DUF5348)